LASGIVIVAGLNHRFTCSAELHALNTASRLAWSTRDNLSGASSCGFASVA
jgi:hypothetical protein